MTLGEATEAYQVYLEGAREREDSDLRDDLEKARKTMEIAWLNHVTQQTS